MYRHRRSSCGQGEERLTYEEEGYRGDTGKGCYAQGVLDNAGFAFQEADVELWLCGLRVLEVNDRRVVCIYSKVTRRIVPSAFREIQSQRSPAMGEGTHPF